MTPHATTRRLAAALATMTLLAAGASSVPAAGPSSPVATPSPSSPSSTSAAAAGASAEAQAAASPADDPATQSVRASLDRHWSELDALYRDLHANPELAFQERRTAGILAERMRALGFEVTEGVGGTGVVALLRNGAGPTVLVRTELDALPMQEKTGLPYASQAHATYHGADTFVAHSCGHDVHMAAWIGTAQALTAIRDQWQGTLMFIAQPAEEVTGGARAMLNDGLYERFGRPAIALALHTSNAAAGTVSYGTGPVTSNSDGFDLVFHGRGSHGSAPDRSIDPIVIGAHFVSDVQSVVSRERDPMQFGVITVGAFQAGSAGNIIPDHATLRGTIRSYDPHVRERLADGLGRTARAAADMAGAPAPELKITAGGSAVVNQAEATMRTMAAIGRVLGPQRIVRVPPITASEDFSEFAAGGVPEVFFFIGTADPQAVEQAARPGGKPLPFNHSPFFAPLPEPSIRTGVQAMAAAVLEYLKPAS